MVVGFMSSKSRRWRKKEQAIFLLRLGELLESGYHLSEALRFMQSQESVKRRDSINEALVLLKSGHSLHEVMASIGFHPQLLQYIHYAEFYGNLPRALQEGGRFWEKRNEDQEKLMKILVYPLVLLLVILFISVMLQGILLPKFEALYENMEIAPSFFLKSIVFLSALSDYLLYGTGTLVVLFLTCKKWWYNKLCPLKQKQFLLKIPFLKIYIRLFDTYYLSYQLSGLLGGGLSFNESMQLFIAHSKQPFFKKVSQVITEGLNEGRSLQSVFKNLNYFEQYMSDVLANGQKNAKLDKELYHYSRIVMQTLEDKVSAVLKIIQPLLFAIVGLIVLGIYLSVLLPMFSIIEGL